MKILLPVLMTAFLLVGCEKIEGQLNITKELSLKNSKGDMHLLNVGTYSADLKAKSNKKITLRLNNDADEKFEFKFEGNIPENGAFNVPSKVSGQPVDLSGSISTTVSNSDVREGSESCTYQVQETVCYPSGPYGQMSCHVQYRTVYGIQWVRFYDRMTVKNVHMSVKAANATVESADFHGNISSAERVILAQTGCR
ncbi:MAG: hypothetical protein WC635_01650 [Bacteriovorax sp.]|jgi:hypothetical protein